MRQNLWRAGHAHPGVLVLLTLVGLLLVDQADLSSGLGAIEAMDTSGRPPGDHRFGYEARSSREIEAHMRWCNEFERLFREEPQGASWRDRNLERAA